MEESSTIQQQSCWWYPWIMNLSSQEENEAKATTTTINGMEMETNNHSKPTSTDSGSSTEGLQSRYKRAKNQLYRNQCRLSEYQKICSIMIVDQLMQIKHHPQDLWHCMTQPFQPAMPASSTRLPNEIHGSHHHHHHHHLIRRILLPTLQPTDLVLLGVPVNHEDNKEGDGKYQGEDYDYDDADAVILPKLVQLLQKVIEASNQKDMATATAKSSTTTTTTTATAMAASQDPLPKRRKVTRDSSSPIPKSYTTGTNSWKLSIAYLMAWVVYDFLNIQDDWNALVTQTFRWTKLWTKLTHMDTNAGLALLGLELISSGKKMTNLSAMTIVPLLQATWYGCLYPKRVRSWVLVSYTYCCSFFFGGDGSAFSHPYPISQQCRLANLPSNHSRNFHLCLASLLC